jgi:hypothetical protein
MDGDDQMMLATALGLLVVDTIAQSIASFSAWALPPTEAKTVFLLTPAASAMASTVVAPYPRSVNSLAAASTMARRVARACAARSSELYGFFAVGLLTGSLIWGDYQCHEVILGNFNLR